ncbi:MULTISPECIES: pyridoxamine 5'-phosphate oxidase family protein [unclassified Microbacterium]|uniref:pyridoxamine 5'-phosphate oxidase family protein n=1 Tax=unclassified Microbacterium TaxID=2609290 RepID=UPI000EA9D2FE|nr:MULTISPECIES: pyridoxamine 5'-phosphate oxidase family protein [unclassified Microbacterium]MBT2486111.1 pyridoxamine 5'-phosphate oxidase family protein [Microbacterium sp. ISL-108]RKN68841.1 pyridoxamine 5'-phosphate oxidase [Microbacterium sp. CGR2]
MDTSRSGSEDADTSRLRTLPALSGAAPEIDFARLPDEPGTLFLFWLDVAIDAAVPEPHAATLATVDVDGIPDARTLILKGVDDLGWSFAGPRSSRKGLQLADRPAAALNFWWQPLVRAVRVRGVVREASPGETAADLAARSAAARSDVAPGDWALWRIVPSRVEFWQGASDRRHTRIVYEPDGGRWKRTIAGGASATPGERERG